MQNCGYGQSADVDEIPKIAVQVVITTRPDPFSLYFNEDVFPEHWKG